jgi:hypothetical protein
LSGGFLRGWTGVGKKYACTTRYTGLRRNLNKFSRENQLWNLRFM